MEMGIDFCGSMMRVARYVYLATRKVPKMGLKEAAVVIIIHGLVTL
jgi:hypothetical protein